ncbi:MAG TPA: hypothetical protein VM425_01460 [Myxococcota bacterium]|nr:hypothetical protein [Myxococcota bacterium]
MLAARYVLLAFLFFIGPAPTSAAGGKTCVDPVFVEYEARIAERATIEQKLAGWQEFLQAHPGHACAKEARRQMRLLRTSAAYRHEQAINQRYRRRSRGGVLAPGANEFPSNPTTQDPVPRNRLRLVNELILTGDRLSRRAGVKNPIFLQLVEFEAAPVYNLGLSVTLPFVAGGLEADGFSYTAGNILLGARGIWGCNLSGDEFPLVLSAGISWGSGSSAWSGDEQATLLDFTAYAAPLFFHLYRYRQSDYAVHAEAKLGLGAHFISTGLVYHVLDQGGPPAFRAYPRVDPVSQMFSAWLGWQWRLRDWLVPQLELLAGLGFPAESETSHLYLSPGLTLLAGRLEFTLSVRVPFLNAADYTNLLLGLQIGMQLW